MNRFLVVPALLAAQLAAAAQDKSVWTETRFHRIHLRNGNFIDGQLVRQTPKLITVEIKPSLEFSVQRDLIQRVEFITMRSLFEPPPKPVVETAAEPDVVKFGPGPATAPAAGAPAADPLIVPGGPAPARFTAEVKRDVEAAMVTFMTAHPDTRRPLALRLQDLGPEGIAYACWMCLRGRTIMPRGALIEAIAGCQAPEVLPTLLENCVLNPDPDARVAAIAALAKVGTPPALAAVHKALEDPTDVVARCAMDEVVKLAQVGTADVPGIIATMNSRKEKGVFGQTLGRIGTDAALNALQVLLREGTPEDKSMALQALTPAARAQDGAAAIALLDDKDPQIRRQASVFLGKAKHGPGVKALIETLEDEDEGVAENALWALRQVTEQVYSKDPADWKAWWERAGSKRFPPSPE